MGIMTGIKMSIKGKRVILLIFLTAVILVVTVSVTKHIPNNAYPGTGSQAHASPQTPPGNPGKTDPAGQNDTNGSETAPGTTPETDPGTDPPGDGAAEPENDYLTIFAKDLFMGDSIAEGLLFYEYVEESGIIAKLGFTLEKAKSELGRVDKAKPENIFLLFGTNDIVGTATDDKYIDDYVDLIREIKVKSPNSKIYVQSVLPVAAKVEGEKPNLNNSRIDELNVKLKDMAKTEGVRYLNIASVVKNSENNLYEPDGLHFRSDFYPLWLDFLIDNVK